MIAVARTFAVSTNDCLQLMTFNRNPTCLILVDCLCWHVLVFFMQTLCIPWCSNLATGDR